MTALTEGATAYPTDEAEAKSVGLYLPDGKFYYLRGDAANKTLRTSLYGTDAAAGDTALKVGASAGGSIAHPLAVTPHLWASSNNYLAERMAYALGDGTDGSAQSAPVSYRYNGATWDRQRGNVAVPLLASAARTAFTVSADQVNHNARGVVFTMDVTANPGGSEALDILLYALDPVSGGAGTQFAHFAAAAATNQRYTWTVYPGVAATSPAYLAAQGIFTPHVLPRNWKLAVNPSGSGSWTYSLGYQLII
jgi:hypothetical protein